MLFRDARVIAKLLNIGAIEAAYLIPSTLAISLGAYITEPGYILTLLLAKKPFL